TTQRHDYPAWAVRSAPARRAKSVYIPNDAKLESETTNRKDYRPFTVEPRQGRKIATYLKPNTHFEGDSTQHIDYKAWPLPPRTVREQAKYAPNADDRDWKSTTMAAYVGHELPRYGVRQPYVRSPVKLDGTTTNRDSYKQWELPAKEAKKRATWHPSDAHFEDATTYSVNYVPKAISRTLHHPPKFMPVPTKFEGESTNRSDYQPISGFVREKDFSPRNMYNPEHDDRDFATTARSQYTPKPIAVCPASKWIPFGRERHADGHVFLKPEERPQAAACGAC
ncbi:hypothetical protein BC832DRAFT_529525, partial [Gaertneriomyces semiglobifer]